MKGLFASMVLSAGFLVAAPAAHAKKHADAAAPAPAAAAPTAAPAGSTGLCKDGTYYSGDTKKGACRGHKGVKDWYGPAAAGAGAAGAAGAAAAMPSKSSPAMPMTPPAAAAAPAAAAPTATPMKGHAPPMSAASRTAAPGGGAGQVWVNEESKVFHCQGDEWYGKTKKGEYMSEADAVAKGNHAAHGKACSAK